MNVLPGKPFYAYTANLAAMLVKLPKFMMVPLTSDALSCIIYACIHNP